MLNLKNGIELEDFYRKKHVVKSFIDLLSLHDLFESQRLQRAKDKLGLLGGNVPNMKADDFLDWLVKRGICPHAVVTANSRYHFENSVLLDGEMGMQMPDPKLSIGDTPSLFFQALNIVRSERSKVKEEEREKK